MSDTVRVNPYRLFGLPEPGHGTFTKDELKRSMKRLVLATHPDKPTGSEKKFRIVMECYKHLTNILREREKLVREVSSGAVEETRLLRESERVEIPASNFTRFVKGSGNKFDLNAFNNFFEENQLDNPMDRGHGDWLKEEDPEAEARQKRRVAKGDFNRAFEDERKRIISENRIVRHTGLQSAYHSTGGVSLDDKEAYTGVVKTRHGLTGVDVREAHENGIITVDDEKYVGVSGSVSMDQAKRSRSSVSMEQTDEDRIYWEREQEEMRRAAEARNQRIIEQNRRIEEHYNRVNKLLTNV